jgi:nitrile hydratase accessory protein
MTVNLHQNGVFEWQEWADTLSQEIHSGTVRSYYEHWLSALEKIVADKALTTIPDLAEVKSRWQQAAIETPHGQAIVLE